MGGNVNCQIEEFPSFGIGMEYGNYLNNDGSKVPFKHKQRQVIVKSGYGFNGARLVYNQGFESGNYKIEASVVSSHIFMVGLAFNFISTNHGNDVGIKPLVGLSYFNLTFFYGYNILLVKENEHISRHNLGLMYSIRLKKRNG
jgi:hypothetical protein